MLVAGIDKISIETLIADLEHRPDEIKKPTDEKEEALRIIYEEVYKIDDNTYAIRDRGKYGLARSDGNTLTPLYSIGNYRKHYAIFKGGQPQSKAPTLIALFGNNKFVQIENVEEYTEFSSTQFRLLIVKTRDTDEEVKTLCIDTYENEIICTIDGAPNIEYEPYREDGIQLIFEDKARPITVLTQDLRYTTLEEVLKEKYDGLKASGTRYKYTLDGKTYTLNKYGNPI